jgi:hypothetical protein
VIDHQADSKNPDMVTSGSGSNHGKEYQAVPDRIENQKTANGLLVDVLNGTVREIQPSLHILPPLFEQRYNLRMLFSKFIVGAGA